MCVCVGVSGGVAQRLTELPRGHLTEYCAGGPSVWCKTLMAHVTHTHTHTHTRKEFKICLDNDLADYCIKHQHLVERTHHSRLHADAQQMQIIAQDRSRLLARANLLLPSSTLHHRGRAGLSGSGNRCH